MVAPAVASTELDVLVLLELVAALVLVLLEEVLVVLEDEEAFAAQPAKIRHAKGKRMNFVVLFIREPPARG